MSPSHAGGSWGERAAGGVGGVGGVGGAGRGGSLLRPSAGKGGGRVGTGGGIGRAEGAGTTLAARASGGGLSVLRRPFEDITEQFLLSTEEIGRGRSGSIRQCVHRRSNEVFACKTIPKGKIQSEEEAEDMRREVEILEVMRGHPCSVQLQGVFEDEEHFHIVMDLCQGGDLWQRVQQGGPYGESEAAAVVGRLVGLLRDLHAQGIMHRDVKPENVLLRREDDDVDVAVIDYGVSVFFNP
ncbi:unnamed protein product, partial [Closterium sp. NIES-53]